MSRWSGNSGPVQRALQLTALTAFAIAQPLFDLLGRNAAFFVAHRAGPELVLAFVALVIFGPALALLALSTGVSLISRRAGAVVHAASVGSLASLGITAPLVRMTRAGVVVAAGVFVVVAIGFAFAFVRARGLRSILVFASPLALAVAALFVLGSPVRHLVFPSSLPAVGAQARVAPGSGVPPVFVLVLDELSTGNLLRPDGSIDEGRYPSFARLANTSTWYPDATTVATGTDHGVPALLTGIRPTERKIPSFSQYPQNLFTLLSVTHELHTSEFVTHLCPPALCDPGSSDQSNLRDVARDAAIVYLHIVSPPDAARRYLPPLGDRWAGFGSEDGTPLPDDPLAEADPSDRAWLAEALAERRQDHEGEKLRTFLAQVRREAGGKPALWYLHLQLPHPPWHYLPDGKTYPTHGTTPGYTPERQFVENAHLVTAALQRSLVQTRFADALVGELMDHLEAEGLFDDTLLVVTSDHGASWEMGRGRRDVGGARSDSMLWVPLFVKYPGQQDGLAEGSNVETADVLPTIAQLVGIDPSWEVDGVSLLDPRRHPSKHVLTSRGVVSYEPDPRAPARWASAIAAIFGTSGSDDDLFGFGEHRELIGQSTDDLERLGIQGRVDLRGGIGVFEDVDPEAGALPAYLRGTIDGFEAGEAIVVGLNGTVAGMGYTYDDEGEVEIAILLSPRHFMPGRNILEIFVLSGGRLVPVGISPPPEQ